MGCNQAKNCETLNNIQSLDTESIALEKLELVYIDELILLNEKQSAQHISPSTKYLFLEMQQLDPTLTAILDSTLRRHISVPVKLHSFYCSIVQSDLRELKLLGSLYVSESLHKISFLQLNLSKSQLNASIIDQLSSLAFALPKLQTLDLNLSRCSLSLADTEVIFKQMEASANTRESLRFLKLDLQYNEITFLADSFVHFPAKLLSLHLNLRYAVSPRANSPPGQWWESALLLARFSGRVAVASSLAYSDRLK